MAEQKATYILRTEPAAQGMNLYKILEKYERRISQNTRRFIKPGSTRANKKTDQHGSIFLLTYYLSEHRNGYIPTLFIKSRIHSLIKQR